MNIQDVADFIDLVKNPKKYEESLASLKAESDRQQAVLETIGKAKKLEAWEKELDKKEATLETSYQTRVAALDAEAATKQKELDAALVAAKKSQGDNAELVTKNKAKEKELVAREKVVAEKEFVLDRDQKIVNERSAQLNAQIAEYEDKLSKLKAVMG